MKISFNLKKFKKQAFCDDGKGLIQKQTRSCMNCYKMKLDNGASAQKAWSECIAEYQKMNKNDWTTKYASVEIKSEIKK